MTEPIPVSQFADIIPHRAPMVWVDEVISVSDSEGECRVYLRPDALYMDGGRLRATAPIEMMTQAFAYVSCARARPAKALKEAFLVSVRNARRLAAPGVMEAERRLRVRVYNARDLGPIMMFDGQICTESGQVLAQASLRIYHN